MSLPILIAITALAIAVWSYFALKTDFTNKIDRYFEEREVESFDLYHYSEEEANGVEKKKQKWDVADDICKVAKYSPSPKARKKQKREDE